jgi:hypothetical protein
LEGSGSHRNRRWARRELSVIVLDLVHVKGRIMTILDWLAEIGHKITLGWRALMYKVGFRKDDD